MTWIYGCVNARNNLLCISLPESRLVVGAFLEKELRYEVKSYSASSYIYLFLPGKWAVYLTRECNPVRINQCKTL